MEQFIAYKRALKMAKLDLFHAKRAIKFYQTLAFIGWASLVLYVAVGA